MNSSNDSLAMQRITKLVDENSFMEIGSLVTARNTDFNLANTDTPSDGVITGHGLVDGNLVFVYSQNAAVLNGTIREMHAKNRVIRRSIYSQPYTPSPCPFFITFPSQASPRSSFYP